MPIPIYIENQWIFVNIKNSSPSNEFDGSERQNELSRKWTPETGYSVNDNLDATDSLNNGRDKYPRPGIGNEKMIFFLCSAFIWLL